MSISNITVIFLTFFATLGIGFFPVLFYLASLTRKKVLKDEDIIRNQDDQITQLALQHLPYLKREVMFPFERVFFEVLNKIDDFYVFPQLNLDKVIRVPENHPNKWIYINQMERKSFDFCLIDRKTFETKLVVELDGDPHVIDIRKKESDRFKMAALEKVGIKFLQIVRNDEGYNIDELKKRIDNILSVNSISK